MPLTIPFGIRDTGANGITWPKSQITPHSDVFTKEINGAIEDAVGIMWCLSQWCHMTKRHMLDIILSVLFMMMLTSCGTDTDANGIMWHHSQWHHMLPMPVANVSHDHKSHITSNFDYLDLRNVIVTLRILTALCDGNTSANGMSWQEKPCCTSFLSYWPKECRMPVASSDSHWHQWHYLTKRSFAPPFYHLDTKNVMVLLTMSSASYAADASANGAMWPKCHVALHFDHLDLSSAVVPLTMLFASHDADASASDIIWSKSHAASHFYHHDPKNVMVLFIETVSIMWQCP